MSESYDASQIEVLTFVEAVQKRASLYFEDCFKEGNLDQIPIEVACHAIDEFYSNCCSYINIAVSPKQFEVAYDAGMSLSSRDGITAAELIMTKQFACRNTKKHLEVGDEFCKVGIAAINAASEWCEVETVSGAKKGILVFQNGELTNKTITNSDSAEFTSIKMKPNRKLFGDMRFTLSGVQSKAKMLGDKLDALSINVFDSNLE